MDNALDYFIGLDLGQRQDYTAISVIERNKNEKPITFAARHLHRYPLGTAYPTIVADVGELLKKEPLATAYPSLVIDATGCGQPVVDMFREAKLRCDIVAVWITAGHEVKRNWFNFNTPKRDLVSAVQVLLQTGRLKIAPALPEAATLVRELEGFQVKISEATAHDSYGVWREGMHDDLVLAVALPLWYATQAYHEWAWA